MTPADKAWVTLGAGILAYDMLAPPGETLSEGADRYMLRHRWLVRGVACALTGHVCNLVPARYDVIHLAFSAMRHLIRRCPRLFLTARRTRTRPGAK